MEKPLQYILVFSCPDQPGIVARVSTLLYESGANIHSSQQFNDHYSKRFFMRVVFVLTNGPQGFDVLEDQISDLAAEPDMYWKLTNKSRRKRVLMLASKFDPCLGDLLYRMRIGEPNMDVVGIVSNHPKSALHLTPFGDVPYHHLPVTPDTKPGQEAEIKTVIEEIGAELIVLARYMQILSDELAYYLTG